MSSVFGPKSRARLIAFTLICAAGVLGAHHSTTAVFDLSKTLTLTGTLTKVDWVNPHIAILIDAKEPGGNIDAWKVESNPPSWFRRVSINRQDFAKALGQTIVAEVHPAKDGSMYAYMKKVKFADGTTLELVSPDQAGQESAAK